MPSNKEGYMKNYYEANKDKIKHHVLEKSKEQVHCDICNRDIKRGSLASHKKTAIHQAHQAHVN
jgi:hypothetical protein